MEFLFPVCLQFQKKKKKEEIDMHRCETYEVEFLSRRARQRHRVGMGGEGVQ